MYTRELRCLEDGVTLKKVEKKKSKDGRKVNELEPREVGLPMFPGLKQGWNQQNCQRWKWNQKEAEMEVGCEQGIIGPVENRIFENLTCQCHRPFQVG